MTGLWNWLAGARPMQHLGFAFVDRVSGERVHYWQDRVGRYWLATSAWAWFRVAIDRPAPWIAPVTPGDDSVRLMHCTGGPLCGQSHPVVHGWSYPDAWSHRDFPTGRYVRRGETTNYDWLEVPLNVPPG